MVTSVKIATAAPTRGRSVFQVLPSQRMASGLTFGPCVVKPTAQVPAGLLAIALLAPDGRARLRRSGFFLAGFFWLLRGCALIPLKDRRLPESLQFENF